jgi:hypothetical protein
MSRIAIGELSLMRAADNAIPDLYDADSHTDILFPDCATGSVIYETEDCSVVIGGLGTTHYDTDAKLIVDLGGVQLSGDSDQDGATPLALTKNEASTTLMTERKRLNSFCPAQMAAKTMAMSKRATFADRMRRLKAAHRAAYHTSAFKEVEI